jgi:KDO2-lipid IV(A) lauroyltransferase
VLFLTGHLGHWELMSWGLSLRGFPVTAVGRESYHPGITDLVGWLRTRAGADIILRDDPGGPRRLLGALARGRIVGLFVDQSTNLPSRWIEFLGRSAPTLEAPARLALRHRGAVVFGWCRESSGGMLRMEIQPVHLSGDETVEEALRVMNGHVERAVRASPDHWVWMHDRWNERVSRPS